MIEPPPLSVENPDLREIKRLARKASEIQVDRTPRSRPGYWDVWAEIDENFEPIGQWPASAIDELARHSNEVWDSTTGKWEIGKHS